VDRIPYFATGHVDFDLIGDLVRLTDELEFVTHDIENAALLEAGRLLFVDEDDGYVDLDLRVLR
jgi:hypothetical protein